MKQFSKQVPSHICRCTIFFHTGPECFVMHGEICPPLWLWNRSPFYTMFLVDITTCDPARIRQRFSASSHVLLPGQGKIPVKYPCFSVRSKPTNVNYQQKVTPPGHSLIPLQMYDYRCQAPTSMNRLVDHYCCLCQARFSAETNFTRACPLSLPPPPPPPPPSQLRTQRSVGWEQIACLAL